MRVLILGLDNPHSSDPELALHPSAFPGSAGARLFTMLKEFHEISEADYLQTFDRANLCDLPSSYNLVYALRPYTHVVALGVMVAINLGKDFKGLRSRPEFYVEQGVDNKFQLVVVPHPSGLTRLYNDSNYRWRTARVLSSLHVRIRELRS